MSLLLLNLQIYIRLAIDKENLTVFYMVFSSGGASLELGGLNPQIKIRLSQAH